MMSCTVLHNAKLRKSHKSRSVQVDVGLQFLEVENNKDLQ